MADISKNIELARAALHSAGRGLTTPDWKRLLEEIGADIDGHLDALNDEAETAEGETL